MTVRYIQKALGGIEDLLVGEGTVSQTRNSTQYTITKLNATTLPYSGDHDNQPDDFVAIKTKIDAEAVLTAAAQADIDGFPDELKSLTTAEIQQLENIGVVTISATQWGYLGAMDQGVATTDNPTFANVIVTTLNTYTFDQGVATTDSPSFVNGTFTGDITVDGSINGARTLANVAVGTIVAGTLATSFEDGDTVDAFVLTAGDRILIKNQVDATENGVYVVQASGAPVRATDADTGAELNNARTFIVGGSQAGTTWEQITATPTIGVDNVEWIAAVGTVNLSDINIDGGTDIGAGIADVDLIIVDDGAGGTNRKAAASRLKTYVMTGTALTTAIDDTDTVLMSDAGTTTPATMLRTKAYMLDDRVKTALDNESGIIEYDNGAIYRFDKWEDAQSMVQGGPTLTSGVVVSGSTYKIHTFMAGDDFSNIGATNVTGAIFTATGTTPTTWTNGSSVYLVSMALPVPYKSSLSNVYTGFEVIGYEGQGGFQRVGIRPGLNWVKNRDAADSNVVMGLLTGEQAAWFSDLTNARDIGSYIHRYSDNYYLLSNDAALNTLSESYISWNWSYPLAKAWHPNGESTRKVPTPWGIVDSVEANANADIAAGGIIIELYNPLTGNGCLLYVGTGANRTLDISGGIAPEFMIGKSLSTTSAGECYHAYNDGGASPEDKYLLLNTTAAEADSNTSWNDTAPTSGLISLGTSGGVNSSGNLQILYYFAPVAGLQAFGGYAGNAGANNQATGCKDGMWFTKLRAGGTGHWPVFDSFRGDSTGLYWNLTNVEGSITTVSFNSTSGMDINTTNAEVNAAGDDYVYGHFGKEMVIQGDINVYPVDAITSTSNNDIVEVYFKYKGAATINTELMVDATRVATPDWVQLTITKVADMDDDWQLLRASGDISANAAGTDMRWRIRTDESGSETQHDIKDLDISWS